MTVAYEFSTQITDDGSLVVPPRYRQELRAGAQVRVILLSEEANGQNGHSTYKSVDDDFVDLPSLEVIVARIQRRGPDPQNVTPAGGRLAEKLANPVTEVDPDFDLETWTREWDRIEAKMKQDSLDHEEAERKEWDL